MKESGISQPDPTMKSNNNSINGQFKSKCNVSPPGLPECMIGNQITQIKYEPNSQIKYEPKYETN